MTQELVESVIQRIAVGPDRGKDISRIEAEQVMRAILKQQVDPVQVAVILIALRMKRESIDEFLGLAEGLMSEFTIAPVQVDELVCLADPFDGYVRNLTITPFIPAVLAACGLPALISGVLEVGPKFGLTAQQVFTEADIATDQKPDQVAKQIERVGWGYIDQQVYAPQLYALQGLRAQIIKRSALTTLERLLHPLRALLKTHAVLGYVHKAYPPIYSAVAKHLGFSSALLSKGVEGGLAPALNKPLRQYRVDFAQSDELQLHRQDVPAELISATAAVSNSSLENDHLQRSLAQGLAVLDGEQGTARNSLVLASAHILWCYQRMSSITQAVEKVQNSLDNGSALEAFNALRNSPVD